MAEDITTVILPSAVWVSELTAELLRENVDPERAEQRARHCLHRIVGHAGYRSRFLVAEEEEPVAHVRATSSKAKGLV